jgi:hypothetical protein
MPKEWCEYCEDRIGEECGITGEEVYEDSYCGKCTYPDCKDCKDPTCKHSENYNEHYWAED